MTSTSSSAASGGRCNDPDCPCFAVSCARLSMRHPRVEHRDGPSTCLLYTSDAQCHTIWEGTENILAIDVRRAIRGEQAHLALGSRIDRALDAAAGQRVLASSVDVVAQTRRDAWAAIDVLAAAPEDLALLQSRRLAELLADTAEAALLVEEAAWSLDHHGDARKAAVARRFVTRKLADPPLRGLLNDDRTVLDQFEPLVRYGPIEPDALVA